MTENEEGKKTGMEDTITASGVDARYQHDGGLTAIAAGGSSRIKRVSK